MKKLSILLILFLITVFIQAQITFCKNYGFVGSGYEHGNSVALTYDGGYILAGSTVNSNSDNHSDVMLVKTDSLGNEQWLKDFGSPYEAYGHSVIQTSDSGYIICGEKTLDPGYSPDEAYLLKTDTLGDTIWTKEFGEDFGSVANSIIQTNDGGYLFTGLIYYPDSNLYLVKTDSNGVMLWDKTCGAGNEMGYEVIQTNDHCFVIVGRFDIIPHHLRDVFLMKIDSLGNTIWSKSYVGDTREIGLSVDQTQDGGYIVCGYRFIAKSTRATYLLRTDANGDTLWTRTFVGEQGSRQGNSVKQANDGGFIIAGSIYTWPHYNKNIDFIKTDSNGVVLWSENYGGFFINDEANSVCVTSDGGFIFGGSAEFITEVYNHDAFLIKTDSTGFFEGVPLGIGNELTSNNEQIKVYPNPTSGIFNISYPNYSTHVNKISIYNSFGQVQMKIKQDISKVDISSFPNGIYFIELIFSDNKRLVSKIIKD